MSTSDGTDGSFNERILQAERPNFFELLSQEAMQDALRPAFQYLSKVFAQVRPDRFGVVWWCSDEIYLLFETFLQFYFIRTHSGSFSERFYSLKRVPCTHKTGCLGTRDKIASMFYLVAVPYIKVKLDHFFSKLQETNDVMPLTWYSGCGLQRLAAVLFFKAYPFLQSIWEACRFVCRLLYLFKKTEFYSPLLYLAGLYVRRSMEPIDQDTTTTTSLHFTSGESLLQWMARNMLPLGVFSLKFLEWWYSSEKSGAVKMMTSLPVPPPPNRIKQQPNGGSGVDLPPDPSLCPLCGHGHVQPTALSSSGYVFCYLCIHDYVRKQGACPVTSLPSSEQQLVRLFLQ